MHRYLACFVCSAYCARPTSIAQNQRICSCHLSLFALPFLRALSPLCSRPRLNVAQDTIGRWKLAIVDCARAVVEIGGDTGGAAGGGFVRGSDGMDGETEMDDSPDMMAGDAHEPGQDPPNICADAASAIAAGADTAKPHNGDAEVASNGDDAALDSVVLFDHPMLQNCAVEVSTYTPIYTGQAVHASRQAVLGLERPDPAPRSRRRWGDEGISIR